MTRNYPPTNWQTFAIYAKRQQKFEEVRAKAEQQGFHYQAISPDFVVTVGGDGTFLQAERCYPGIPKLPVRDSLLCYRCHDEPLPDLLNSILKGRGITQPKPKLEAKHAGAQMIAVNDVILRNAKPTQAIRLSIKVDGQTVEEQVIGDGIVAATPFGSTGYFRSVTGLQFDAGIGLAFNNATEAKEPLILDEKSEIVLEVIRGPGQLAVDNAPEIHTVETGDKVTIRQADMVARLVVRG